MDLIERYIYAVTRRLPASQRDDLRKELRGLIEDMLHAQKQEMEPTAADIEAVLMELGEPAELADQYRGKKKYLIGPENFDTYILVLKIVLAAVAFGITLAMTIGFITDPPQSLLLIIGDYLGALVSALFQAFAWLTVVFVLFDYFEVAIGKEFKGEQWSPASLPHLPAKELEIKPFEPIIGIIFAIITVVIFNTADHLLGIYISSEDNLVRIIPLFNHEAFRSFLPLLNIMLALGMIKESLKLVIGRWTPGLAILNMFFNLVSFGLFLMFVRGAGLWNEAFLTFWSGIGILPPDAEPVRLWGMIINGIVIFVAIALIIDSAVNLVKGLKTQVVNN